MNYIAEAIQEISRWYGFFNTKYFDGELEEPAITIQKARANNYGHCTKARI